MSQCDCAQCVLRRARVKAETERAETEETKNPAPRRARYEAIPRMCVQCHHIWFPIDGWEPPGGTAALVERVPVELRPALLVLAYLVCRVEAAGPVSRLSLSDLDDEGRIASALVDAGLIETHPSATGGPRWTRTEKGAQADD